MVKIERDVHCQSWPFLETCTKSTMPKRHFSSSGPNFLCLYLVLTWSTTHEPLHASLNYLFDLLWFYSFKIQIKSNKIKINHVNCFWIDFGIEWGWYMLEYQDQIVSRMIVARMAWFGLFWKQTMHWTIKIFSP